MGCASSISPISTLVYPRAALSQSNAPSSGQPSGTRTWSASPATCSRAVRVRNTSGACFHAFRSPPSRSSATTTSRFHVTRSRSGPGAPTSRRCDCSRTRARRSSYATSGYTSPGRTRGHAGRGGGSGLPSSRTPPPISAFSSAITRSRSTRSQTAPSTWSSQGTCMTARSAFRCRGPSCGSRTRPRATRAASTADRVGSCTFRPASVRRSSPSASSPGRRRRSSCCMDLRTSSATNTTLDRSHPVVKIGL